MKTRLLLGLLGLAILAQLAAPASMILRRERVLARGQAFKFRTAPVDPYDAFRGRYVALRFDRTAVALPPGRDFARGQKVHALLAEGEDGFAFFRELRRERPGTEPYLTTTIQYMSGTNAFLALPFERFYMDEYEAPEAERVVWRNSVRSNQNAYVQVRIEQGFGVIEDLYVAGTPIRTYLEQNPAPR